MGPQGFGWHGSETTGCTVARTETDLADVWTGGQRGHNRSSSRSRDLAEGQQQNKDWPDKLNIKSKLADFV